MSDISILKELRSFTAASPLATNNPARANAALWALARAMAPAHRPVRHRVSDMLAAVMALSARTRRSACPRVNVDIDVFAPGGQRALRIFLPYAD